MYKEIIKDLTNPQTNNKIVKKLSALSATGFYNLSDKNTQKIRDILN